MRRSEINRIVARAEADFERAGFALPAFGRWSPDDWRAARPASVADMLATGLGWDVTDFGEGEFERKGLLLFTVRNGTPVGGPPNRPYAEKIMISRRGQLTPMHRHLTKVEDIINRSSLDEGARLAVKLFATEEGRISNDRRLVVHFDGMPRDLDPGSVVELLPGESVTLFPGTFHAFWGEGGDVVVGEVSSVNDDVADNVFAEPTSRFTGVEEDEAPRRLLVSDYAGLVGSASVRPGR